MSKYHALDLQNHFSQGHISSEWHSPDWDPTTMKKQELHNKCIIVNRVLLIVFVQGVERTVIKNLRKLYIPFTLVTSCSQNSGGGLWLGKVFGDCLAVTISLSSLPAKIRRQN